VDDETGADCLVVSCPKCLVMLEDAVKTMGLGRELVVKDISELLVEALINNGQRKAQEDVGYSFKERDRMKRPFWFYLFTRFERPDIKVSFGSPTMSVEELSPGPAIPSISRRGWPWPRGLPA